jgi:NAD(P)-dependent dehydrogenase (short-subunit alcohol dehydrogenase family)
MDYGLKNKVVLITGGSRGIGKATAIKFANEGAQVYITYAHNQEAAQQTVEEIQGQSGFCQALHMKLKDYESIQKVVQTIGKQKKRIDVLVNNAVVSEEETSIEHSSTERWFSIIDENIKGTYMMTKEVVPFMKITGWGRLIHVSSILAQDGLENATAVLSSKAALHGFSKSLAVELAANGIYSNVVLPGLTLSEWVPEMMSEEMVANYAQSVPAKRVGTPEDVANLIVYLGSTVNSFVNGEVIRVAGGK